jgi:hypothetical protein
MRNPALRSRAPEGDSPRCHFGASSLECGAERRAPSCGHMGVRRRWPSQSDTYSRAVRGADDFCRSSARHSVIAVLDCACREKRLRPGGVRIYGPCKRRCREGLGLPATRRTWCMLRAKALRWLRIVWGPVPQYFEHESVARNRISCSGWQDACFVTFAE